MNAATIATFEKGDELKATMWLYDLWSKYPARAFWENWPYLGPFESVFRQGVLDNTRFKQITTAAMTGREFKRDVAIMAVDLNTAELVIFDETTPPDKIWAAVTASATVPAVFPPLHMGDYALVDGGTFTNLDISESIIKCRNKGFEDKDIIVDAILCFDSKMAMEEWTLKQMKYKNAYDIFKRNNQLKEFYYYFEDLIRVIRGYPDIQFRHLITPDEDLGGAFIPVFDGTAQILQLLAYGEKDAAANL